MQEIIANTKVLMTKSVESLEKDLAGVNTGRATPVLLEPIRVEAYNSMVPLNRVANVSTTGANVLLIQVWDKSMVNAVEKGIQNANLGFNPQVNGTSVLINVPKLSEERRKELCKLVKKYGEERKVSIRNARKDGNEHLKKLKGSVSDDAIKHAEDEIQKLTDKFSTEIDKLVDEKNKSLLTN